MIQYTALKVLTRYLEFIPILFIASLVEIEMANKICISAPKFCREEEG